MKLGALDQKIWTKTWNQQMKIQELSILELSNDFDLGDFVNNFRPFLSALGMAFLNKCFSYVLRKLNLFTEWS